METNCVLLVVLLLVLVAVDFSGADSKVNVSTNTGLDPSLNETNHSKEKTGGGSSNLVANTALVNKVNVENGKGVLSEESEKKVDDDDKKGKSNYGVKPKEVPKDRGNEGDSDTLRKGGPRPEECGSSNMCNVTDEENKFVACLRVPGNDSPDLLLLIQNKGKGPLSIAISAPEFVKLEKNKVELKEKQDKKVMVSVRNGGTDNSITLTAGNSPCNLDFRDLIAHNSEEESDNSPKFTYSNYLPQKPTIAFLSFAALLILASGWMCISFRRRQLSRNGSKYQRLDRELPVSGEGKSESINDGWDNSWGDDWEDEEAPKTPSIPVTPSLSSKGLASRRLNKEGWKD